MLRFYDLNKIEHVLDNAIYVLADEGLRRKAEKEERGIVIDARTLPEYRHITIAPVKDSVKYLMELIITVGFGGITSLSNLLPRLVIAYDYAEENGILGEVKFVFLFSSEGQIKKVQSLLATIKTEYRKVEDTDLRRMLEALMEMDMMKKADLAVLEDSRIVFYKKTDGKTEFYISKKYSDKEFVELIMNELEKLIE